MFFQQLAWLADPRSERPGRNGHLDAAYLTDDAAYLRARQQKFADGAFLEAPARVIRTLGTDHLALPIAVAGRDLTRLVDEVGIFRDPGVVRVVAYVATQRKGQAPARAFLRAHADYVRPILEALRGVDDPKEQKAALAALALLDDASAPAPLSRSSESQVEAEIAQIFATLGRSLRSAASDEARAELIRDAHERYTEARSTGGFVTPEAYFTHRFGEFQIGEYAMLAVDAIG